VHTLPLLNFRFLASELPLFPSPLRSQKKFFGREKSEQISDTDAGDTQILLLVLGKFLQRDSAVCDSKVSALPVALWQARQGRLTVRKHKKALL
jgi:hypothetical protein